MLRSLLLLLVLFDAVVVHALAAQTPTVAPDQAAELSIPALQARVDGVNADQALSADAKAPLLDALARALEAARATEVRQQALQRYADQRASVAERLAQRRRELQALDGRKPGPPRSDLDLAALERGLAAAQQAQLDAQKFAVDVEAERARRTERRAVIPGLTAEAKSALDALPQQPAEVAGADPRLASARRLALRAERSRLQTELDALAAEAQTYEAEVDLLRAEGDLAARGVTATKADVDAWLAAVQPMRKSAAEQAEREARRAAARADPRVTALASENAKLASTVTELAEQRQSAEGTRSRRDDELRRLQQDFTEVKKKAVLVSADALGALLRQRRASLVETGRRHQQSTRDRNERIADSQLRKFDYEGRRQRLIEDPDAWLTQELGGEAIVAALPAAVVDEARRLRDARRDLLQQLVDGYDSLVTTELEVQTDERKLTELISNYRAYVAERVLGIRSSPPLWQLDAGATADGVAWLLAPDAWRAVARLSLTSIVHDGWPVLLFAVLFGLFGMRRSLGRRLAAHGERATRGSNVVYAPTALAALDSALLALPLPALFWLLGWRLGVHPECTEFGKAIAAGAVQTAWALFLVLVLALLVRPRGLAEAHFQWQSTTVAQLRRAIPLLLLSVLPFSFLIGTFEAHGKDVWTGTIGSLSLLGQLALLTVAFARLLHPTRGIVGGSLRQAAALYRFRRLWYLFGAGTPLALLVMVVFGYDYSALQLTRRLHVTVAVLVAGVFVHASIVRSLVLERRRLQIRKAQERMQAAKGDSGSAEAPALEEVDPQSLARQTQTLLRGAITIVVAVVAFQVWVDVLPALGALRTVQLWNIGDEVTPQWISLADVLLGAFLFLASLVAARNLPALLELFLLQRLSMQAGERNAVTTLARYGILIVGVVWSFSSIGLGWSKVQWLVAAVSVGLGFGLQEIFANFVSGLILLLERPIRVGDIVQVGTTTGRVTRIRIRATTIQDWDRKELVVPNREFVTSQFVNWTLSDPIVRWVLPVGVAYGSDTEKALRLLEQIARKSRFVRDDPHPEAVFVAFGNSTLNLELRLYVDMNSLDYRWMTDLYQAIDQAFREARLEIAFPQRDVNLKLSQRTVDLLQQRNRPS